MNRHLEIFLKSHSVILKDEITNQTLYTRTVHTIHTGNHNPRKQYNGRIPIHIDRLVASGIDKLFKQGIIFYSKSQPCSSIVPILK